MGDLSTPAIAVAATHSSFDSFSDTLPAEVSAAIPLSSAAFASASLRLDLDGVVLAYHRHTPVLLQGMLSPAECRLVLPRAVTGPS